jgi:putative intracellular protease/amidase
MRIAIGLYERFTSLDAMGPFQVLSSLPGAEVTFVAEKAGPVTDESGFLTVTARASFADLPDRRRCAAGPCSSPAPAC